MQNITISFSGYNILNNLKISIRSFLKYHPNMRSNIVVFDDNSTDGTKEWLDDENIKRLTWSPITFQYLLQKQSKRNITYRVNLIYYELFSKVNTKYLLNLDGDTLILKPVVDELLDYSKYYDIIGILDSKTFINNHIDFSKYVLENKKVQRIWPGFLFLNLDVIKNRNIWFDDIDDDFYNKNLSTFFDSGVNFYYKLLLNNIKIGIVENRKIGYYGYMSSSNLDDIYIVHFGGISVKHRLGKEYNLSNYHKNQFIDKNSELMVKISKHYLY